MDPPKVDHSEQFKPKFEFLRPSEPEIRFFNYTRERSCGKSSVLRFTQKVKVLELNVVALTPLKSTIPNSLSPNLSLYDLQKPRYSYTRLYACSRPGEKMGVVAMGAL